MFTSPLRTMLLPIVVSLSCIATAEGCGDSPTASVSRVVVTAPAATVQLGKTVQLTAKTLDSSNKEITGNPTTWSSANPEIASVSPSGLAQGLALGSAVIRAEIKGITGDLTITVVPVPVASVTILNGAPSGVAGKTMQLSAAARDSDGNSLSGRSVEWSTSNSQIGTVNGAGLVTFLAPGTLEISARVEGIRSSVVVSVSNPPAARVRFPIPYAEVDIGTSTGMRVVVIASDGDTIRQPDIEWTLLDGAVATVDGKGTIRGTASGTARVIARSGAAADTALIVSVPANGLIGTAFVAGSPGAAVGAGDLVAVDVALDLSRVSTDGDLGASEFELSYDSTLLTYDRIASTASGTVATNAAARGRVRVAFASANKQGSGDIVLATIILRVAATAPVGIRRSFGLTFTARPVSTGLTAYLLPVTAGTTVTVKAP